MDATDRSPRRHRGRRIARVCAGFCLVLVAGWIGLWFLGRGLILSRLDQALAAPADGLRVEVGEMAVAGFPFAYRVTLRDLTATDDTGGGVYRVDAVETRVAADAPDRLVMRLPSRIEATLPGTDIALRIETEAASLTVDGLLDAPRRADLNAQRLRVAAGEARLDLTDVVAVLERRPQDTGARLDGRIARLDWQWHAIDEGEGLDTAGRLTGLTLAGSATATDILGLSRLLAGEPGQFELDVTAEMTLTDLATAEGASAERLALDTGTAQAALALADGRLSSSATLEEASISQGTDHENDADTQAAPGGLRLSRIHGAYEAPAVPTAEEAPFSLRFALDGVQPTGDLLAGLEGADAPGRLRLDLRGAGRLEGTGGNAPPRMRISRLTLAEAQASGLGASASADGGVEVAADQRHLNGRVEVTLDGTLDLLRRLRAAGIIDQGQLQAAATGLALYTVGADAPDRLKSAVVFEGRRVRVNGARVR